jgi:hypothetical protein
MGNSKDEGVSLKAMMAKIAELEAALAAKGKRKGTLKVSEKGAISIYGFRRMPITLYLQEMEALLAMEPEIRAFIKTNDAKLSKGRAE